MDVDVAASEAVPRFVDLALFLCGTALRNLRGELQPTHPATVALHRWYLHRVCFLHTLPGDTDGSDGDENEGMGASGVNDVEEEEETHSASMTHDPRHDGAPPHSAMPSPLSFSISAPSTKEVNFRHAFAQMHASPSMGHATPNNDEKGKSNVTLRMQVPTPAADAIGRVHARSSSPVDSATATFLFSPRRHHALQKPRDVGYAQISEFLRVAYDSGGVGLFHRVAAAVADTMTEHKYLLGTPQAAAERAAAADAAVSSAAPAKVLVSTLSSLFEEDLLEDELSMEAGNATRSFHIWVNYEWASASILRQTHLASVASTWLDALRRYHKADGQTVVSLLPRRVAHRPFALNKTTLSVMPTNLKAMYAALEEVFEGHTKAHTLLMEMALSQRAPHLTDNALAKLLFLQGPSLAANMSRSELANRGTQPILTSITSGMLLYTQYYLSFHSLDVARRCVRVALQVAQEVHSNSILALAHYTAHVVAVHQGRPADAANSISIALQLSLGSLLSTDSTGLSASGGGGDASSGPSSSPAASGDGQMASVAFAGAAQLLLFFPGAVGAALRSVLSTGRLEDANAVAAAGESESGAALTRAAVEDAGRHAVAVSAQTVAQSIRHALLRAETSLLHTPPVEGRWVGVAASLHRETLTLMAALYGVVSTPTAVTEDSLRDLIYQMRREADLTSPLFMAQGSRTLFWEVLRHSAHHALSLQERFLVAQTPETTNSTPNSSSTSNRSSTSALECLHAALYAIRANYGEAAVNVATNNVFFAGVVRYCAACHLQNSGYATAAYELFTTVAERLCQAAGMDSCTVPLVASNEAAGAPPCWQPDHLLLYAVVQRRRAEAAAFLGLVSVAPEAQQALLAVSARYAFSFGVLTAQLMEAQTYQHNGRYNTALAAARRVERAAGRIGFPSLVEAACALQVTAYASSGDWQAARRLLLRLHPRHGGLRVFLLLQKFSVHLELLLAEPNVSSHDVGALTRSWIQLLRREKLLSTSGSTAIADDVRVTLTERICFLSTLTRAWKLIGRDVTELQKQTLACMQTMTTRHGVPVPDVCVHGDCEEVCQHARSLRSDQSGR